MGLTSCVRLNAFRRRYGEFRAKRGLSGCGCGRDRARGFALGIPLEDQAPGFRRFFGTGELVQGPGPEEQSVATLCPKRVVGRQPAVPLRGYPVSSCRGDPGAEEDRVPFAREPARGFLTVEEDLVIESSVAAQEY